MKYASLLAAAAALAVGGCGQKGPLYLPDKGAKVVTTPAPPAAPPAPTASQPTPAPKPNAQDQDPQQPPK